jgi:hypothetical protein
MDRCMVEIWTDGSLTGRESESAHVERWSVKMWTEE